MTNPLLSDPTLASARVIEGYKVLDPVVLFEKLGEGGMGAVYRGQHLKLDIPVAVKCMKPFLAAENEELVSRFQREAKVAAGLDSENLVRVFDVLESEGIHYLVMEYVAGETIRERVQRSGPIPSPLAVAVIYEAARGLMQAHKRGIVHRDIKPDNIILARDGRVKVADLGLAKAGQDTGDAFQTRSGAIMGTPNYMPPEQFEDASSLGPTADVYSLALTLYYMLAGQPAVESGSLFEVLRRVREEPLPDLAEHCSDLPSGLDSVFRLATAREPFERPETAAEFMGLLGPYRMRQGVRRALAAHANEDHSATRVQIIEPSSDSITAIREAMRRSPSHSSEIPETFIRGEVSEPIVPPTLAPTRSATSEATRPAGANASSSSSKKLMIFGPLFLVVLVGLGAAWFLGFFADDSAQLDEEFRRGTQELRGSASLERGVRTLLHVKEQDPDYPGLGAKLGPALLVLCERQRESGDLGAAWKSLVAARSYHADADLADTESSLRSAAEQSFREALKLREPSGKAPRVIDEERIVLEGQVDLEALASSGLRPIRLLAGSQEIEIVGGAFRHALPLQVGAQKVSVSLSFDDELRGGQDFDFIVDLNGPQIVITDTDPERPRSGPGVVVEGTVVDESPCRVRVRNKSDFSLFRDATVQSDEGTQTWTAKLQLIDGPHGIIAEATDAMGRKSQTEITILVDTTSPRIVMNKTGRLTGKTSRVFRGRVEDLSLEEVRMVALDAQGADRGEARRLTLTEAGRFESTWDLSPGLNRFRVEAKDRAGNLSRTTIEVIRETPGVLAETGRSLAVAGDLVGARSALRRALKLDAQHKSAQRLKPLIDLALGDVEAAESGLASLASWMKVDAELINDQAVTRWWKEARQQKDPSSYSSASVIAELGRAVRLDSSNTVARSNLGVLRALSGQHSQGLSDVRAAVGRDAKSPVLQHNLGFVYYLAKRDKDAVAAFDAALRLQKDRPSSLIVRGLARKRLRDRKGAEADLRRGVALMPKSSQGRPPLAVWAAKGEVPALVLSLSGDVGPILQRLLADRIQRDFMAGRYTEALAEFPSIEAPSKALMIQRVEAALALGDLIHVKKARDWAAPLLKRADLSAHERQRLQVMRASARLTGVLTGPGGLNAADAVSEMDRALLDSERAGFSMARGRARMRKKDWKGAKADFTQVIKHEPDNAFAFFSRSTCESWLNNWAAFHSDAQRAHSLNPSIKGASERLERWFVVMQKPMPGLHRYQQLTVWPAKGDPQDTKNRKEGFAIDRIVKGRKGWTVFWEKATKPFQQIIHTAKVLPKEWIVARWNERYRIQTVGWSGTEIVIVMRRDATSGQVKQSYLVDTVFPTKWMKDKSKEGFCLKEVSPISATSKVFILEAEPKAIQTGQSWLTTTYFPSVFLSSRTQEFYRPSMLMHDGKSWLSCLKRQPSVKEQRVFSGTTWPRSDVKKAWEAGFGLVTMAWGPDTKPGLQASEDPYGLFDKGQFGTASRALIARSNQQSGNQLPYYFFRRLILELRKKKSLPDLQRDAIHFRAWASPQLNGWMRAIMNYFCGALSAEALIAKAGTNKEYLCEAHYYVAAFQRARGDTAGAKASLRKCIDQGVTNFTEHRSAVIEMKAK